MKKLKINACLEPMDEWTYESYVCDYLFEEACIEESLDNIKSMVVNLVSVNLETAPLILWNAWISFLIT